MPKKGASVFGLLIGIAIVVIGVCLLDISFYRSAATVGKDIRFGADFYTEMYDVTRDVGYQVSQIDGTIAAATRWICQAIGWLIISLGAIDICYFISKLTVKEDKKEGAISQEVQSDLEKGAGETVQFADTIPNVSEENDTSNGNSSEL